MILKCDESLCNHFVYLCKVILIPTLESSIVLYCIVLCCVEGVSNALRPFQIYYVPRI